MRVIIALLFILGVSTISSQINQNFDVGNFLPSGWSEYHSGINALKDTNERFNSPSKSALFDDVSNVDSSWMISSQLINLSANSELTFWQNQNYGTYYVYHAVLISTGSNLPSSGDFVLLDSLGAGTEDTWEKKTIDLSSYSGQDIYIAFLYIGDFADEWYLDDIKVAPIGQTNCVPPTIISSSNVTQNSLKLSWTPIGGELSWVVEYGLAGFTPGTGLTINSSSPQITIPNLQANTFYDHYIKANCGGTNNSFLSHVFTEKTACVTTANEISVPYTENFESVLTPTIPCGWKAVNNNGDTITWITSTDNPNNGQNSAYITYTDNSSLSHNDWLFSPYYMVTDTSVEYNVGFSYASKSGSAFPEKMEFYTAKSKTGGFLKELLFRDTAILTNNIYVDTSFTFKFNDTGKHYFGFHIFSDGNQWDFLMDDFYLETTIPVGVHKVLRNNDVKFYPNPTSSLVTVISQNNINKVTIFNISGILMNEYMINKKEYMLNLNDLKKGVYIVLIEEDNGIISRRLIKE